MDTICNLVDDYPYIAMVSLFLSNFWQILINLNRTLNSLELYTCHRILRMNLNIRWLRPIVTTSNLSKWASALLTPKGSYQTLKLTFGSLTLSLTRSKKRAESHPWICLKSQGWTFLSTKPKVYHIHFLLNTWSQVDSYSIQSATGSPLLERLILGTCLGTFVAYRYQPMKNFFKMSLSFTSKTSMIAKSWCVS